MMRSRSYSRYRKIAATDTDTTATATASQRSCWRSTPRARRKRTTSDQAPTGMASPAGDRVAGLLERRQRQRHQPQRRCGRRDFGPPPPAGRGQRPGRGEQQYEADAGRQHKDVGVLDRRADGGRRSTPGRQHPARIRVDQPQPESQQQSAHRVTRPAAGQHHADRGRAHRHQPLDAGVGIRSQVQPAGLARQLVQPDDHREAEHDQRPQRPRQPGRPPASPCRSGGWGHPHGRRRIHAPPLRASSQASSVTWKSGRPASRDRYGWQVPRDRA
jgi:hypothetical protein